MTTAEFEEVYERMYRWRANWFMLARHAKLQLCQDRIVRRIKIADNNISRLINTFHQLDHTKNTHCHPRGDDAPRWILVFDGDDGHTTYYSEKQARAAFALATTSGKCHLFQSVKAQ